MPVSVSVAPLEQFLSWTAFEAGAIDTLKRHGTPEDNITIVRLPGAFEMPLVLDKIAAKGGYDAIVARCGNPRRAHRIWNTSPANVKEWRRSRSARHPDCLRRPSTYRAGH